MQKILAILFILATQIAFSQTFGEFPRIEKEKLNQDLGLLHQGLDKFHSGMYWYTPKDSVELAFENAKKQIDTNLNVLEFHKIIAPLVALSREDHTDIFLPKKVKQEINSNKTISLLPLTVLFLGESLYCVKNASDNTTKIEALEIETINGETPKEIVFKAGNLFASDGYIKAVKYSDLRGFNFSKYYYYYYGIIEKFQIKFNGLPGMITIQSLPIAAINANLQNQKSASLTIATEEPLEFKIIDSKTAYLGISTFSNSDI